MSSPAGSHETFKLERPGVGEYPGEPRSKEYSPNAQTSNFFFFCETKLLAVQAREECRRLSIENCFAVNMMGLKGGLVLCWNTEVLVTITSYSNHHIDDVVQLENGKQLKCTGIYRHPEM